MHDDHHDQRVFDPGPQRSAALHGLIGASTSTMVESQKSQHVCIGVIADIQYRDTEDMYLEKHGFTRSYRAALPKTVEGEKSFRAFFICCLAVSLLLSFPQKLDEVNAKQGSLLTRIFG